jgi:xanthine dehydrogenase YagR molybdenum-binding subunit
MSRGDFGEYSEPCGLASEMLYPVPNAAITHRLAAVNQGLPTYMRAPGEAPGVFALESAMDEIAVGLNMDPLELRLLNYAEKDWHEDKPFSAKKLRECYQVGAEMFGWFRRSATPGTMRDGRMLVGYGMATSTYPMNRMPAHARVRLDAEGIATVQAASQDIGTGTYTIMTQVAAEVLGLPYTRVRVELGNSAFPPAPVSGGSMTVASLGPAVQAAAEAVRAKLFAMAGKVWQVAEGDPLRLEGGVVIGANGRISVTELLGRNGLDSVQAVAEAKPGDEKQHYSLHSFGAQFCEVRVDPDLGTIRVARWVGAFDCGRVMNPKTARSQLIGGITFGIGMALLEETLVDPHVARIVNSNVAEYLMPVNADIPHIQTYLAPNDDRISNPLGARGLGELPMVGVAPAVANAVYNATGRRVRRVPIRIEDVLT